MAAAKKPVTKSYRFFYSLGDLNYLVFLFNHYYFVSESNVIYYDLDEIHS
jgi:hypothetical protein